jgi:uncharacterized protein
VTKKKYRPVTPKPKSKRHNSWLKRRWRYIHRRLVRLEEHPEQIARGFALGAFSGCFPLFGLQTIIGILLATIFRASKLAAAAGTWISNPITYVPIFAFNFKVGNLILQGEDFSDLDFNFQSLDEVMELGASLLGALFLGSFLVGLTVCGLTYFCTLWLIDHLRKK